MKTLSQLPVQTGTRTLLRVDFNVTIEAGKVVDDFRIRSSIPTIQYLQKHGARILILSHLGRPKGHDDSLSLRPIIPVLERFLGISVPFFKTIQEAKEGIGNLKPGDVALLENLRFDSREEEASETFTHELAELGDVYVNDAFGTAHRKHASVYSLAKLLPAAAGFLLAKEVEILDGIRTARERPLVFVMGGAKAETKIKTLISMLPTVDAMCLGGLISNTILRAHDMPIGKSWISEEALEQARQIDIDNQKIHLPIDAVVSTDPSGSKPMRTILLKDIQKNDMMLDAGPKTIELFSTIIRDARMVVWNGPLGLIEVEAFSKGTAALAQALKETKARVIVGGGDVMRIVHEVGVDNSIYYESTGGGAMLEYLADGTLPALEVLM